MIETLDDYERAIQRLTRRPPASLARFIMTLLSEGDPVGDHVQTFIVADDVNACVASIEARLSRFAAALHHRSGRRSCRTTSPSQLNCVLDAIEEWVQPVDTAQAFELLIRFLECDAAAAEACVDDHYETQEAFRRAVALLARTARHVSPHLLTEAAARLLAVDEYGLRVGVAAALGAAGTPR